MQHTLPCIARLNMPSVLLLTRVYNGFILIDQTAEILHCILISRFVERIHARHAEQIDRRIRAAQFEEVEVVFHCVRLLFGYRLANRRRITNVCRLLIHVVVVVQMRYARPLIARTVQPDH